jgi:hypothetical protein
MRQLPSTLVLCAALAAAGCGAEEGAPTIPASGAATATSVTQSTEDDPRCRLATVDASGPPDCPSPVDGDHDGVNDGADLCPDTTPGVTVDAAGCARTDGTEPPS